jgi:hypothetical protein
VRKRGRLRGGFIAGRRASGGAWVVASANGGTKGDVLGSGRSDVGMGDVSRGGCRRGRGEEIERELVLGQRSATGLAR